MSVNLATVRRVCQDMIRPVKARVQGAIARAVVRSVVDSGQVQGLRVTLLADEEPQETIDNAQPYGLTAHPPPGSEAIHLSIGGDRSHGVLLGVHKRGDRPTDLKQGEVALYSSAGVGVYLDEEGLTRLGSRTADDPVTLSSLNDAEHSAIEAEFALVQATLDSLAGQAEFGVPYVSTFSAGSTGASKVRAE